MRIVEALDQVRVSRTAAARAHRQLSGELRLGRCRKRAGLLVAHQDPLDPVGAPNGVDQRVEAVADHAVNARHASLAKNLYQLLRHCLLAHCRRLERLSLSRWDA